MKILQDLNGALYIAKDVEEVAAEDVQKLYDHLKNDLAMVEKYLGVSAQQPSAPADANAQAAAQLAGDPNQAAQQVTDPNAAVPAAPVDPNQPATEAPAVDANGNPVQAGPAPDPNIQPQEQVMPPLQ